MHGNNVHSTRRRSRCPSAGSPSFRVLCWLILLVLQHVSQARPLRYYSAISAIRGGSTATVAKKTDDLKAYRLQQQLCLQTRSFQLRQALIQRGLDALQVTTTTDSTVLKPVDWDCALSTEENPMSCLFSFDAEVGAKVVAPLHTPLDAQQWVTLSSLNRLRRNDPSKIDPLWHSQYAILRTWFRPNDSSSSSFSFYNHLSPAGTLLSVLLDAPVLLAAVLLSTLLLALLVTLPVWERLLSVALTSRIVWMQWPSWGRFVHAALPLKLLLGQMAWKALAVAFGNVYGRIRTRLVEWECQMWQDCIPLTILPDTTGTMNGEDASADGIDEIDIGYDIEEDDDDDDE